MFLKKLREKMSYDDIYRSWERIRKAMREGYESIENRGYTHHRRA